VRGERTLGIIRDISQYHGVAAAYHRHRGAHAAADAPTVKQHDGSTKSEQHGVQIVVVSHLD
jgi:hypothetical protein